MLYMLVRYASPSGPMWLGVSVFSVMCSECALTSPVSIESGMLVMCRMQCLCPSCCNVVMSYILVESMCLLL